MTDLLCFGEPLVEFNQRPDGIFVSGCGGDISNCAVAAKRSGISAGIMAAIGDDLFGDQLMAFWAREDVSYQGVVRMPNDLTGVYFVTHGAHGHAFTYRRAGSAASKVSMGLFDRSAFRDAKCFHFSAISQAISGEAMRATFDLCTAAKENGLLVSYDTNFRPQLWSLEEATDAMRRTVPLCDIVLPGLDDAMLLTGQNSKDAIADYFLDLGAKVVALTLGAHGAFIATPTQRCAIPGRKTSAVDATGAGDAFDGAFLAAFLSHGDPFEAGRAANLYAANSVASFGAT